MERNHKKHAFYTRVVYYLIISAESQCDYHTDGRLRTYAPIHTHTQRRATLTPCVQMLATCSHSVGTYALPLPARAFINLSNKSHPQSQNAHVDTRTSYI